MIIVCIYRRLTSYMDALGSVSQISSRDPDPTIVPYTHHLPVIALFDHHTVSYNLTGSLA